MQLYTETSATHQWGGETQLEKGCQQDLLVGGQWTILLFLPECPGHRMQPLSV